MSRLVITLLFVLLMATACGEEAPVKKPPSPGVILLSTQPHRGLMDSLARANVRVARIGFPGETAEELLARLPWSLQTGAGHVYYDTGLAGVEVVDTMTGYLEKKGVGLTVIAAE